jgi:hypothetical protein
VRQTNPIMQVVSDWLKSCTRKGKLARNTIAVGIVVLDHLRQKCPIRKEDVFSDGGELTGIRSGLSKKLARYGIPPEKKFLKEATTRQAGPDGMRLFEALRYGGILAGLDEVKRDAYLVEAINGLVAKANEWLARKHLTLSCDGLYSPGEWVHTLLADARDRSNGKVEQHLVGAKLEERHPDIEIPNQPGNAGDMQTGRGGDFTVGSTCYHVTVAPGGAVIDKCMVNLSTNLHPVLLVPREQVEKARHIAEDKEVARRMDIIAIEDFIAINIVEMTKGQQRDFVDMLRKIIDRYNRRVAEVETDSSLKIELQ